MLPRNTFGDPGVTRCAPAVRGSWATATATRN